MATVAPAAARRPARRRRRRARRRARRGGSSPRRRRRAPVTGRPSSSISLARATPTRRGSSQVAPLSGVKPRLVNGSQKRAVVGGDGEVGGEGELAAEAGGPAPHRAHHRQLDLLEQRDEAVGLERRAALEAAGAGLGLAAAVGRDPVGAGAEVVAGAGGAGRPAASRRSTAVLERLDDARATATSSEPLRSGRSMVMRSTPSSASIAHAVGAGASVTRSRLERRPERAARASSASPNSCSSTHARFSR